MAKKPTRSQANKVGAGRPATGQARQRREVGSETVAGREPDRRERATTAGPDNISESLEGHEQVGQAPGDAVAARIDDSPAFEPTKEDIRLRAYHLYLERGGGDGLDFDDWLRAERELRERRR